MTDLFEDKAHDWDTRPVPAQISAGVSVAMTQAVVFRSEDVVLDFGAGTGLVASKLATRVSKILAVDVSRAMLDQLAGKPELADKVEIFCQDILHEPLEHRADAIVSAMAAHHVEDTDELLRALFEHLVPGGRLALADLDSEDGSFHPPDIEGVYHTGFDRDELAGRARAAGFEDIEFVTACEVDTEGASYPIFLMTATRPADS